MNTNNTPTQAVLSWRAPSQADHHRGPRWYVIAGGSALVLGLWGILTGSWTFTIVLLLSCGLYMVVHRMKSPEKTVVIQREGIAVDDQFTPWSQCAGFWMLQGQGYAELHIERTTRLHPEIVVQTGTVDSNALGALLSQVMPVLTQRKEKLLDAIIRICKL